MSTAQHPHTGRAIHHRYTSHGILLAALLVTGILLFNNLGALRAYGLSSSGSQTIAVNILGTSPIIGADITFPVARTMTRSPHIQVLGHCAPQLLVATYNNGAFAGSSVCTTAGDYTTTIQLFIGVNILQSQDYDGLNQPGPVTAQVQINREQALPTPAAVTPKVPTTATTTADTAPNPSPLTAPAAPQPAINPCFDTSKTNIPDPTSPSIIANCIKRSVFTGDTMTLPIRVNGGSPPYALSIDWGDKQTELKTVATTEYHSYQHTYKTAGIISVSLKATDAKGITSFLQTVVQVANITPAGTGGSPTVGTVIAGLGSVWTEAPVPLYVAAVTLVLGFWVGDIFQRLFAKDSRLISSGRRKKPPTPFAHHRHA